MLIFNGDKNKDLSMVIETKNIDSDKLTFTFNIIVENIKYGFECKVVEGKVQISVPALNNVIKNLKEGEYKATLDVTGDNKYYLNPFNEDIKITQEPKVDVVIDSNNDIQEELSISISKILESEEVIEKLPKPTKRWRNCCKFSKVFN